MGLCIGRGYVGDIAQVVIAQTAKIFAAFEVIIKMIIEALFTNVALRI